MIKNTLGKAFLRFALCAALLVALPLAVLAPREAFAFCCICYDCDPAQQIIEQYHDQQEDLITDFISDEFDNHRDWLANDFFEAQVLPALQRFTAQMSAVAMQQVMAIGMFLDAKQQLETQRTFQELQAQAHKDYQPSEDFCWFGTNVRSMAGTEQKAQHTALALTARQLERHLSTRGTGGAESTDSDKLSRWRHFAGHYCDLRDNNWEQGKAGSGLSLVCPALPNPDAQRRRLNIDVDFTRLIEEPRTLDVDFTNVTAATDDEEDILAMSSNLYGHNTLLRSINPQDLSNSQYQHVYLALRSVAAKRSVAENSFNNIVGLKSSGTSEDGGGGDAPETRRFLAAVLVELGVPAGEVFEIIGENPSYFAQLEVLAKKIYQSPDFYANLYDKPANVARKSVALKAIDLMLDRAIYESQLRQEMAMSVLLASRLRGPFRDVNSQLQDAGAQ